MRVPWRAKDYLCTLDRYSLDDVDERRVHEDALTHSSVRPYTTTVRSAAATVDIAQEMRAASEETPSASNAA